MSRLRRNVTLAVLCVLSLAAADAAAQTLAAPRASRPYRGLFGGGLGDVQQVLTLTASAGGGGDSDLGTSVPVTGTRTRSYGFGSASLAYAVDLPRFSVDLSGSTTTRYYTQTQDDFVTSRSAYAAVSVRPFTGTQLFANASASRQPYNMLNLFPALYNLYAGRAGVAYEDFAISGDYYTRYVVGAGAAQDFRLGRRSALTFDYAVTNAEASIASRDYRTQQAGATFTHSLTQSVSANAGYRFTRYDYPAAQAPTDRHSLDVGLALNKALSLTRRTTLSARTGSSAFVRDDTTQYRLTGDAALAHEIGRTWSTSLGYQRSMGFLDTFDHLVFYDALTATLAGLMTRRVDLALVARVADGQIGFGSGAPDYTTYMGTATLTTALTRHLALSGSYFYHHYEFENGTPLPPGVPDQRRRHGIRAAINVWAPLFSRARTP